MAPNIKYKIAFAICFLMSSDCLFAHDVPVHQAITFSAAESAKISSFSYGSLVNMLSLDLLYSDSTNALVTGSRLEDNVVPPTDVGGYRSLNHFYDPLDEVYGKGLSDSVGFSGWGSIGDKRVLVGTNSFAWASISNCSGVNFSGVTSLNIGKNFNTYNTYSWPNARYAEWLGLTATSHSARQTNLLLMFRSVGQVMHLLQDASQPQHVRNEQHVNPFAANSWREQHDPWASPIEIYGINHLLQLNYQHGILDWNENGFVKLEDFWDRHLYEGNAAALAAAENGGAQLGMAEWCNGNFLGARHQYGEYYLTGDIRYYPYPSFSGTSYQQIKENPLSGLDAITLANGKQGYAIYLSKVSQGITLNHQSRLQYLGAKFPNNLDPSSTTIADDNVLRDYHNIFIPKAVQYSAGLLDYFSRGEMRVSASWDSVAGVYNFTNINTSSQDFLNGSFYLFEEDTSSNRTLLQSYGLTGILPSGGSTNLAYPGPLPSGTKFLMIYKGTIGQTNGSALDPVDAGIGIAAAQPSSVDLFTTNSYDPSLTSLGLDLGATISSNLLSGDLGFTPIPQNCEVIIDQAYLDDNGSVGGIATPVSTDCAWPHTPLLNAIVPVANVSVVGDQLQISITATDNSDCGANIGWANVIIDWRVAYQVP